MRKEILMLAAVLLLAACETDGAGAPVVKDSPRETSAPTVRPLDTQTPLEDRYVKLAQKAEREKKPELAAVLYRAASLANDKDPKPRIASAELYEKVGENAAAGELYAQLAGEQDDNNFTLASGRNFLKAGNLAAARDRYEAAIVREPGDWRGYNGLGVVDDFTDRHAAARKNYVIAFDRAPGDSQSQVAANWALSLMLDGEAGEAVKLLEETKAPKTPALNTRLAIAYGLSGKPEEAKKLGLTRIPTQAELQRALRGDRDGDSDVISTPVKR